MSKSDSNKFPTRSGQSRLWLEEGYAGDARCARPCCERTEGQTDPSEGLTFRVGTDEDPDAAAGGHEVRRQGGEVPGESRPPKRGVPGTGQLGARTGRPHRPLEKSPPPPPSAARVPVRGSAERRDRYPQAARFRAAPSPRRRRRAPWRTLPADGCGHTAPRAFVAAASCPAARPPSSAGVQRSSRWEREVSVSAATRVAPLCAGKHPWLSPSPRPCPRLRPAREEGAAKEAGPSRPNFIYERRLELSEAAHGLKGGGGVGLRLPRGFLGFTVDDPERPRLLP